MPTDNGGKRGKSKSGANISQHAWVSYLCLLKIQFKSGIVLNGLASHVIVQSGLHQNNRVNTKSVKKYRLLISIKVCTCLFQNASHCIYLLGAITIHNVKTMHIHVYMPNWILEYSNNWIRNFSMVKKNKGFIENVPMIFISRSHTIYILPQIELTTQD